MAKKTLTIFDILRSRLDNLGYNQFYNKGHMTFFDEKYRYIQKMLRYDDDIHEVLTDHIFKGYVLKDVQVDKQFKRGFLERFQNRSINSQTIEDFSSKLLHDVIVYEDYIINIFNNYDKYLTGEKKSVSKGKSGGTTDNRALSSELPQDNINLNVDDTVLDFGTNNNISRSKDVRQSDTDNVSNDYSINNLGESIDLIRNIYDKIDKHCFLQIF